MRGNTTSQFGHRAADEPLIATPLIEVPVAQPASSAGKAPPLCLANTSPVIPLTEPLFTLAWANVTHPLAESKLSGRKREPAGTRTKIEKEAVPDTAFSTKFPPTPSSS